MSIHPSDDVAGHAYRLAQERTLILFCRENGLDPETATDADLAPILDANGEIVPAPSDLAES